MENKNSDNIKLINKKHKYLTKIDNEARMKSKLYSNNQSISYNVQGELIINNECLTKKEKNIEFSKCEKNKNQFWNIDKNKIFPVSNPDLCIFSDKENIELKKCTDDEKTIMNIEDSDTDKTTDYRLKKYKGKTIVLVDSDNPWYLNKDTTIPMDFHNELVSTPKLYRDNADYSDFSNNEFEHFKTTNSFNIKNKAKAKKNNENNEKKGNENESLLQNHVIFLLLIVVVLLFIYKKINKSN